MKLAFTLTMPGVASWNGRWSGDGRLYVAVRSFGNSQKTRAKLQPIIDKGSYSYGWSDGWRAAVTVREVEAREGTRLQKVSNGFCGYEWMIDSILAYGRILADHEKPEMVNK